VSEQAQRADEEACPSGSEPSAAAQFVENDAREFTQHLRRGSSGERGLPSFEEMRRNAYRLLGDAQQELYSDWRSEAGPSKTQLEAARKALRAITEAKKRLIEAAAFGKGDEA
jgi:hypothetical protein